MVDLKDKVFIDHQNKVVQFNPQNVLVINQERKQLPFIVDGIKQVRPDVYVTNESSQKGLVGFVNCLKSAVHDESKNIELVLIDSLTRVAEILYDHLISMYSGYDLWDEYGKELRKIIYTIGASTRKPVIWISLETYVKNPDGTMQSCAMVDGKMKGKVESYFENVLWTSISQGKTRAESYKFQTYASPKNPSAKTSPAELYQDLYIPNDMSRVLYDILTAYRINSVEEIISKDFYMPNVLICGASGTGKSYSLNNLFKR